MGHVCRKQNWDTMEEVTKHQDDMERTLVPTSARYIHVGEYDQQQQHTWTSHSLRLSPS